MDKVFVLLPIELLIIAKGTFYIVKVSRVTHILSLSLATLFYITITISYCTALILLHVR